MTFSSLSSTCPHKWRRLRTTKIGRLEISCVMLCTFSSHCVFVASIGTLLAITCDRYRVIAHPLNPRLSGKFVKIILAIIWLSSLAISSPLIIVAGEVRPATGKVFCDETWPKKIYSEIYWNFIFVIQYFSSLDIDCRFGGFNCP